jgi:hypothetical protein
MIAKMDTNNQRKTTLALSLPLAVLIIIASCVGLFTENFYSKETTNWIAQAIGQDAIDLFLVTPFLMITAILARKNEKAFLLWAGVNLYLVYTFVIYCFDVHFNSLFLIYCFALGLSFYSSLYFLFSLRAIGIKNDSDKNNPVKSIAVYFLIISCLFYFLWLSEIIPAIIKQITPEGLIRTGLVTNPVHVIDLAVILPGIFILSIMLFRKKPLGLLLAPSILVFFILMDITIGGLVVVMNLKGLETNYTVTIVMSMLTLLSILLLLWYLKARVLQIS